MSGAFAQGKHALGECDMCGFAYPLRELRAQMENQQQTAFKVCPDCWTPDHPQLQAGKNIPIDGEMLRDPRPDRRPPDLINIRWGWMPVWGCEAVSGLGAVTVSVVNEAIV